MQDKIIFREMLSELKKYADEKQNELTKQEIKEFLKNAELSEEQYQYIYEYLVSQKIRVEGYVSHAGDTKELEEGTDKTQSAIEETEDHFLNMYIEELEDYVMEVSPEEELNLFWKAAKGDAMSKSTLVEQNLRRVYELVKEYENKELSKSDLVQEGNIGLILAVDRLEELETLEEYHRYIFAEIKKTLEEAEEEQKDLKHMDQQMVEQVNYLNEAIRNLEEDLERKVSIEELSVYLEMPVEEIQDILRMAGDEIELNGDEHSIGNYHQEELL